MKKCNMKICSHYRKALDNCCLLSNAKNVIHCKLRLLFQRLHKAYLKDLGYAKQFGFYKQWTKELSK